AEAAHGAVVGGEGTVLEDGVGEGVGGDHLGHQTGLLGEFLQLTQDLLALGGGGVEGDHVVVVEGGTPGGELCELAGGAGQLQGGRGGGAELCLALPARGPQAEGERVITGGCGCGHGARSFLGASAGSPSLVSHSN